ncbi:O-methyltransferase COMT-type protein, partial [Dioscorea alata]
QIQVWNLLFSYLKSMCLKSSLELGIADALKKQGKPMKLSELTSALSIPPSNSPRVIRRKAGDSGATMYVLTPASRLLVKDEAMNIIPFLTLHQDPMICDSSHVLGTWFKSPTETPFELYFGKGFWDVAREKPEFSKMFNEGMASDSRLVSDVVMMTCRDVFKGLKSVVDVGGGNGTMARSIAHAFPEIKCTVFDLPHVIDALEDRQPGVEYVGGDMFVSVPHANAVLLKCVKILQRCKEAIPSKIEGGKLIIIDVVVGAAANIHSSTIETQLLFDLLMMSLLSGRERNECEWRNIFQSAGFEDYKITYFSGVRSIIELYP